MKWICHRHLILMWGDSLGHMQGVTVTELTHNWAKNGSSGSVACMLMGDLVSGAVCRIAPVENPMQ